MPHSTTSAESTGFFHVDHVDAMRGLKDDLIEFGLEVCWSTLLQNKKNIVCLYTLQI